MDPSRARVMSQARQRLLSRGKDCGWINVGIREIAEKVAEHLGEAGIHKFNKQSAFKYLQDFVSKTAAPKVKFRQKDISQMELN